MATRPKMTKQEKLERMASDKCYVCEALALDHAGFDGYEAADVDRDHYKRPFASVGGDDEQNADETKLIHSVTGGTTPDDHDFESSTQRNCHVLKRDDFAAPADYVQVVRGHLEARNADYVDDVYENKDRDPSKPEYSLPVTWEGRSARFMGKTYPTVTEVRRGKEWTRFLAQIRPGLVFTDRESQVRPAKKDTVQRMLRTYLSDGFPTLAAVNARIDRCGHVVIFDGNHRATAFAIAFGLDEPMPIMIWKIEDTEGCAFAPTTTDNDPSGEGQA